MLESNADPNSMSRLQLLELAQQLRVSDADVMTRAELRAAIEKARRPEPRPRAEPVTWVSVARRLLASIVEQGLNLPDAAALIRGDANLNTPARPPPPVATVTLARIYATQGHLGRALGTLDEVLTSDPDHDIARDLRAQLKQRLEQQAVEQPALEQRRASEAPLAQAAAAMATPVTRDEPVSVAPPTAEPVTRDSEPVVEPVTRVEPSAAAQSETVAEPEIAAPETVVEAETAAPETVVELPTAPGLVLIEETPQAYLYWELVTADTSANDSNGPHWISIVTHTPNGAGCVREERQFPVHAPMGALRLEGLPRRAVVRARLSRQRAPESKPLVVAACVSRQREAEPNTWVARFVPHSSFDPTLSDRALQRLPAAKSVYW